MPYGVFPNAVTSANALAAESKTGFRKQLHMLRHLLGVVKCDANEVSYGSHYASGSTCVNSLCWIACHPRTDGTTPETKELICFLLDNGGDPDMTMEDKGFSNDGKTLIQSARESARQRRNPFFLTIVEEWEAKHKSKACREVYYCWILSKNHTDRKAVLSRPILQSQATGNRLEELYLYSK